MGNGPFSNHFFKYLGAWGEDSTQTKPLQAASSLHSKSFSKTKNIFSLFEEQTS
jgi:hypothetical protein